MTDVTEGGANIFDDLGLANADELAAKAELMRRIHAIVKRRRLTQRAAADLLGLKQPDVSLLMRGRVAGFSTERLIRCLNALGRDVDIVVRPARRAGKRATVRVVAA